MKTSKSSYIPFVVCAFLAGTCLMSGCQSGDSSAELLEDRAAISAFAISLQRAVREDSTSWLAERTQGYGKYASPIPPVRGLPSSDMRTERRIQGWQYWMELYDQFGHFDLLREYSDEKGPHLIYRSFDGQQPVYTDLLLGQRDGNIILLDWTEHPGALSEHQRDEVFRQMAQDIGRDALMQTIETLLISLQLANEGRVEEALEGIDKLPVEWRSNAVVIGDQLRIMADAGHQGFPQAILRDGGLLGAAAVAHLAFSWSLQSGNSEGLSHSTEDLREQFGEDPLLDLYRGLSLQWSGDCEGALKHYTSAIRNYPANPVLAVYPLNCLSQSNPHAALEHLQSLLPGTGFAPDELDEWLSIEAPALHRSPLYREWLQDAPAVF